MITTPSTSGRDPVRSGEHGAILLVALVLGLTFSLLSLALLATSDNARRSRDNAAATELAERAAISGIEWAAARVIDRGASDITTTLTLGTDQRVVVDIDPTSPPHVTAQGLCGGTSVTLAANLDTTAGAPLPCAFASFSNVSRIDNPMTVYGSAYFGRSSAPIHGGSNGSLTMHGDLNLVASSVGRTGFVTQVSGTTNYGCSAYADPVVDTTPYETMPSGAVPVVRYNGTTTLNGVTVNGVLVVKLGASETLTLNNATVNGTVVVISTLDLLGGGGLLGTGLFPPKVVIAGTTHIVGGTATTGNLALLADTCGLQCPSSVNSVVEGVSLVASLASVGSITFRGQLVVRGEVKSTTSAIVVDRPVGFAPVTPIGIVWPGPSSVRIQWLGRQ